MNPEVKLSDSEILQLSNAGHNEIADLASGNNILDIQKLRVASQGSRNALAKEISQIQITDSTRTGLQSLLTEAAKNPGVSQKTPQEEKIIGSSSVQEAATGALGALKNALEPQGKPPAEFLSIWREVKAKIPGMEVGWLAEIQDALNQSRQYNKDLINYLVAESKKPDLTLDFNSWPFSNRPGMFPEFPGDKFGSVEEKQKAIINALNNLESLWRDQWSDASGMGMWWWAATVIGFYLLGKKIIWDGGKAVVGKVKWFGIGSTAVAVMDAVGGVAGEKAEKAKQLLEERAKEKNAILKEQGFLDPSSPEFKEYFDVGEKTIRADASLSEKEKIRRIDALEKLKAEYTVKYQSGKFEAKFAGNNFKVEVGRIMTWDFGTGNIDNRANLGKAAKVADATGNLVKEAARKTPWVGKLFQAGKIGALDAADSLKMGNSLEALHILGEEMHFKDAQTKTALEDILESSKARARALRIQEKFNEISIKDRAIKDAEKELKKIPEKIELQTDTQSSFGQSQTMKRQEINPDRTEKVKMINALKLEKQALEVELSRINPDKLDIARAGNIVAAENAKIEGKMIDLKTAYPNANIPTYDPNNRGMNFERFVLKIAKMVKK